MVIFDCPNIILEQLAEQASNAVGFRVIVSNLRTSIEGAVVRSFDYEWYPTPEFAERPTPWQLPSLPCTKKSPPARRANDCP